MGFFRNSAKIDLLQKSQENLEMSQKNMQITLNSFPIISESERVETTAPFSDEDKQKAAYALNLCMISISQIIDYDDIYILEQEYDAILNNLNLEEIPKDEALLSILKQLLDTITFFRIQEGDKKFLEREYQQKTQNAIWSAVPNIGAFVLGGDLVATGISIISQVGIGYMNYRKTKAQINLDKEKTQWQLQRSAMEQFNGLRRELFDTAWRLADKYNFPDRYRITERQIAQYNKILLDSDYLRRYERLAYVKEKFEAYPPFWYYMGNAANIISQDERYNLDVRSKYRCFAIEHFERFTNQTNRNLLREDQILASGALEYFDLLIASGIRDTNREKLEELLTKAKNAAGNSCDVLELCAISYLKIGNYDEASSMLRMLVNERYNTIINAQLLSSVYVANYIQKKGDSEVKTKYETLCTRIPRKILFPLPEKKNIEKCDVRELKENFLEGQKIYLLGQYEIILTEIIKKYTILFNKSLLFPGEALIPYQICFSDSREDRDVRKQQIEKYCKNEENLNKYVACIENFWENILSVLDELYYTLKSLPGINCPEEIYNKISESIKKQSNHMQQLEQKLSGEYPKEGISSILKINFLIFVQDALNLVIEEIVNYVFDIKNMLECTDIEGQLIEYGHRNNLPVLGDAIIGDEEVGTEFNENPEKPFLLAICETQEQLKERAKKIEMQKYINENIESIKKVKNIEVYKNGTKKFKEYISKYEGDIYERKKILAIVDDKRSRKDIDLLLTTDGLHLFYSGFLLKRIQSSAISYKSLDAVINYGRDFVEDYVDKLGKALPTIEILSTLLGDLASIETVNAPDDSKKSDLQTADLAEILPNILFDEYEKKKESLEKTNQVLRNAEQSLLTASQGSFLVNDCAIDKYQSMIIKGKVLEGMPKEGANAVIKGERVKIKMVTPISEVNHIYTLVCAPKISSEVEQGDHIVFEN